MGGPLWSGSVTRGGIVSRKHARRNGRRRDALRRRQQGDVLTGTIHVSRPGVATVETAEGVFAVGRGGIREAMSGDEVQVSLSSRRGRERLAYVQGVARRATATFLGTFRRAEPLGVVVPLDARIRRDFFVLPTDDSAHALDVADGDVVAGRILEYPTRKSAGVVTIERRVGSPVELDMGIEAVVASYGLVVEFASAALEQAEKIAPNVAETLALDPGRRDLRQSCVITVDPSDARDFDDAIGARRRADGYELEVHIADVTNYVSWASPIDEEARRRTCSAYLVDRVIPMLPERLCDDVCSLKPQEDRLCMSVIVRLDCRGEVLGAEVLRTAVRSKARLDYAAADRLLAGEAAPDDLPCDSRWRRPVAESLAVLDELASLRRERRARRGSIDFVTREAKVILDAAGHPKGVSVRERTRATSLVEEAMLLANESVAKLISDAGLPCAYRVHERPSPEELEATIPVLRELGLVRGTQDRAVIAGDPRAIRAVLEAARGTTGEVLANSVLLRAQKRAVYLPHNDGHYALAAPAYCHFTSPIRRYPDIIVHRALKLLLAREEAGRPGGERVALGRVQRETERILPQLCRTCSERERAADAAAHASQRVKMAELYAARVGEDFSGVVVGVERYGLFVMIEESRAEGLLSTRSLGSERFIYDESLMALTGEESGACWRPGRRIAVRVASVDVMQGQIDFALAGDASASGTPRRGRLH